MGLLKWEHHETLKSQVDELELAKLCKESAGAFLLRKYTVQVLQIQPAPIQVSVGQCAESP